MMITSKLIIFVCQVLEYQPEPSNQWTTIGQLETGRTAHAALSIGSEVLPCLQGHFEYADQNLKVKVDQVMYQIIQVYHTRFTRSRLREEVEVRLSRIIVISRSL